MSSSRQFLTRAVRRAAGRLRGPDQSEQPPEPSTVPSADPAAPEQNARALVSVVVTVTDTQLEYLDECLDSLRAQTYAQLQLVVVPHGPADEAAAVVRRHALDDHRLELVEHREDSLGAARNAGAARASGTYLAFVDGADRVPARAYESLVASLEETGSDFAVGRLVEAGGTSRFGRPPGATAHRLPRAAILIADLPEAITDTVVENRLFTLEFWNRSGLTFPESGGAVPALPMVESYLLGARFDVLTRATYQDMHRGDGIPFGHQVNHIQHASEWLATQRQIAAALAGRPELRDAWLCNVLDREAPRFLDDTERATDAQWQVFSTGMRELFDQVRADLWLTIRAESRVKVWLAAHGLRAELEEFADRRRYAVGNKPTLVEAGTVYARLPYFRDRAVGVPDECFVLTASETPVTSSLRRARWVGDTLELELVAIIDYVDLSDTRPSAVVWLTDDAGARIELPVGLSADPAATRFGGHRFQRYDPSVITVTVDARTLADQLRRLEGLERSWAIDLELTARGVTRTGRLSHADPHGSAVTIPPRELSGVLVEINPATDREVRLRTALPAVSLTEVTIAGRTVSGTITAHLPDDVLRVRAETPGAKRVATAVPMTEGTGSFQLTLPEPVPDPDTAGVPLSRTWALWARAVGKSYPLAWLPAERAAWVGADAGAALALHRADNGRCEIVELPALELTGVEVEDTTLGLQGRWLGAVPDGWTIELGDDRFTIVGEVDTDGRRFRARFSLLASAWGFPAKPLPAGSYRFTLRCAGRSETTYLWTGEDLAAQLPREHLTANHRARVVRTGDTQLGIRLGAPLADDELGSYAQQRLQDWFTSQPHVLDESAVYLQAYVGHSATDSALAIHQELRRTRPELTLYWGVADRSALLPEGAVPVLLHSRQWYDVVATSKYLVNNVDFDAWFTRQPGQLFLQTFHGYPSKTMGMVLWHAKQFGPRRIALELSKTSAVWDLILTPTPEMDRYYRSEYCYEGAIHNQGYPRDDVLTAPEAPLIRDRTRARLGIRAGQTVVLYAPTWRDHLAGRLHSTRITNHLDLEAASAALGDDYVLLMRGHRFHARANQRTRSTTRVIDVTDYPEINDLILAADVAVLDYSSLRFDFGLTGKPMIFLVPDLEFYTGGARGFLFDYRSTAPGPLLSAADQVVEAILELDAVREKYADDVRRFIETYHSWQDGHATERVVQAFFGTG